MKSIFINDIKEILEDSNIDEILAYNEDLRKKYCKFISKKYDDFFKNTANNNNYNQLVRVYVEGAFAEDSHVLKQQELQIIKKYLMFNNLKHVTPEQLEQLNQANTIMSSIKEEDFEEDMLYDGKSRSDVINFIRTYDNEFYETYTRLNNKVDNKVKYELKMIQMYEEYLKVKEKRK